MFGILMLSTRFCALLPLHSCKACNTVKVLCEWEVLVETKEGADFHFGVYVVLNRNGS